MNGLKLVGIVTILFLIGCQEDRCDEIRMYDEVEHSYTQKTDGTYQVNILKKNKGAMGYCDCYRLKNENDSIWEAKLEGAIEPLQNVMLRNPNEYNCF